MPRSAQSSDYLADDRFFTSGANSLLGRLDALLAHILPQVTQHVVQRRLLALNLLHAGVLEGVERVHQLVELLRGGRRGRRLRSGHRRLRLHAVALPTAVSGLRHCLI